MIEEEVMALVRQYLRRVSPSGPNNVMAVCPFHIRADGEEERNPSFAVALSTGLYFCHSCGARGGLRRLLQSVIDNDRVVELRYGGLIEAVKRNLPPPPDALRPDITCLDPIPEGLLGMFTWPTMPQSLTDKGFTDQTLRHFEVGHDPWHNRITFPLRDWRGNLVGISGRATDAGQHSRYKIYTKEYERWGLPPRPTVNKASILYNAQSVVPAAYLAIQPEPIVVVEGFKACMWVWQAGITNVVALLGNRMTWEQGWMLERLGTQLILFLDGNTAGQEGTAAIVERWLTGTHVARYPRLPAQPDDLTPEEVRQAINQATPGPYWRYS